MSPAEILLREPLFLISDQSKPVEKQELDSCKFFGLLFSANWCPPCKGFLPHLVSFCKTVNEGTNKSI